MTDIKTTKNIKIGCVVKGLQTYDSHFKNFLNQDESFNFSVYHLNSFYNVGTNEISKKINPVVDLFNISNYYSFFKSQELDYVIFLNPGHIFDQLLILIFAKLKIKTIYLQHGVKSNDNLNRSKSSINLISSFRKYTFFIFKYFYHAILLRSMSVVTLLLERLYSFFINNSDNNLVNIGSKDNPCTFAFVFTEKDKENLNKNHGYSNKNIFITGFSFDKLKKIKNNPFDKKDYAVYISSGLRQAGVINITDEEELSMYKHLYQAFYLSNLNLAIKLHPREGGKHIKKYFQNNDRVKIIDKSYPLADLVFNSQLVLGDYSTAIFYGIKYFKPILLIKYSYFDIFPFDLEDYGIGTKVFLDDLKKFLKQNKEKLKSLINNESYKNFLMKYDLLNDKTLQFYILSKLKKLTNQNG